MLISRSPWTGERLGSIAHSDHHTVTEAVISAASAFTTWSSDAAHRHAALQQFSSVLVAARARIVDLLVREAGKNIVDAEAEADLLPKKIAISLDAGLARTPQQLQAINEPQCLWRPRGVAAVLGPFNFPLHLLHGLVVPALAVGCTVVAKPSERCPLLGALYAELLAQASLHHVCHVIHGGADTAKTLISQSSITTVAAVGGRHTGLALQALLAERPEVVLALELGGVNPAIVLPDASLESTCSAIADGAWRMAGQRCTATRHVHVPRPLLTQICEQLCRERERWQPDGTPQGVSGSLISEVTHNQIATLCAALPNGLRLIAGDPTRRFGDSSCCDPILLQVEHPSCRSTASYREEHFGPLLIVDPYDDVDECLVRVRANPYRLATSIFTNNRTQFLALAAQLPYGQVNHNRPTAGARSDQPFGGLGAAGNGRPAAVAAGAIFADECVVW